MNKWIGNPDAGLVNMEKVSGLEIKQRTDGKWVVRAYLDKTEQAQYVDIVIAETKNVCESFMKKLKEGSGAVGDMVVCN